MDSGDFWEIIHQKNSGEQAWFKYTDSLQNAGTILKTVATSSSLLYYNSIQCIHAFMSES